MPAAFARTGLPSWTIFGDGAVGLLAGELDQRNLRRAMLIVAITTRSWQSAATTSWDRTSGDGRQIGTRSVTSLLVTGSRGCVEDDLV
jgi:hypothetical protein